MKKFFLAVFALCFVLCSASCDKKADETSSFNGFSASFLNTGKSDCIIIHMDDIVIMCDTSEHDYAKISSTLKSDGIDKIDYMILTHFDKDHIGAAGEIIRNFEVDTVFAPKTSENSDEYEKLTDALTLKNMEITYLTEDTEFSTQNGNVRIFAPLEKEYDDDNAYSLITEVKYKDSVMLLTGDATKSRLSEFLSVEPADGIEVIKLPHHGEYTKSLLALISRAQAKYGIVTCDEDKSTVESKLEKTAERYGMELLYTFEGDIVFEHDENSFVIRNA